MFGQKIIAALLCQSWTRALLQYIASIRFYLRFMGGSEVFLGDRQYFQALDELNRRSAGCLPVLDVYHGLMTNFKLQSSVNRTSEFVAIARKLKNL